MENKETFKEYSNRVLKKGSNTHKITNSYGVVDAYKFYNSIRPRGTKYFVKYNVYCNIIRTINNKLRDRLVEGDEIKFPYRMGELLLIKHKTHFDIKDGNIVTNKGIDWGSTIKLWYSDKEMEKQKKLVYHEEKTNIRVLYSKRNARYKNLYYYRFKVNREAKVRLNNNAKAGKIDAFINQYSYGK